MAGYPESITLNPGSDEYKLLFKHSQLFQELVDIEQGPIELSADFLFAGDQTKWQDFVDIFFPELGVKLYFGKKNNNIYVLPNRGNKESLKEILDFLMVDSPDTMMDFAKAQARKQMNISGLLTVPKGVGIRTPGSGAQAFAARQAAQQRGNVNNEWFGSVNNNIWANNNEEQNTRPGIRVNNNGNNAPNNEGENEENNVGNVVRTNNNTTRFGRSRARGPVLNFSQLFASGKVKTSKKGGARRKRKTHRRRQTHRK